MNEIFAYISKTVIWGWLPLDLLLHCVIGGLFTLIALKLNFTLFQAFIGLVVIAGLKEINDYSFHTKVEWTEYASDFAIAFVYIGIIFFVRKSKNYMTEKTSVKQLKVFEKSSKR